MKLNTNQLRSVLRDRKGIKGFTLLELLIVVGILAIIGGALIAAYDGIQTRAAQGVATNTIASVSQAMRSYAAIERELPDNLESLVAADATGAAYDTDKVDNVLAPTTAMAGSALASFLEEELKDSKFAVQALTLNQKKALVAAGIDSIRYLDTKGEAGGLLDIKAVGNGDAYVQSLADIDIPQHAFDVPRDGGTSTSPRARGRGFSYQLKDTPDAALPEVAVWNAGTNGYNNVKVGANPNAVLVGLGVGNRSSIVNANDNNAGGTQYLASAPIYGAVKKNEYNHYIALVDVSASPARFVAIVDSKGDFLDEEYAEATSQKK